MTPRLIDKLRRIRKNPNDKTFVLADAKDADMAFGISSPGPHYPTPATGRPMRSMPQFVEQVRQIVRQAEADILLASVNVAHRLAAEGVFKDSAVTPAVRLNDTTDVWVGRGARYRESPSRPYATTTPTEAMYGTAFPAQGAKPVVSLGLYSMTFNNDLEADLRTLETFKQFRQDAQRVGMHYILEVFGPNLPAGRTGVADADVGGYVNDMVVRALAGVPDAGRPEFLKIPFFSPAAVEELVAYDPTLVVGVLGGSAGTTYDAFLLLEQAQKYGARVALFGRKIKDAEDPLAFIATLRQIVDGELPARDAVKAYHDALKKQNLPPRRSLEDDLRTTAVELSYARA